VRATARASDVLWSLTWANIIAFGGIIVNLLWNFINSKRDKRTRRNALSLDHFSSNVRAPLQEILLMLGAHMDAADDIVTSGSALQMQSLLLDDLKKSFHATRRKLARLLTDYDSSDLVDGQGWAALESRDMDNATDYLDRASRCATIEDLREQLLGFVRSINDLRTRISQHLDSCASMLMNY
jgi:hypothetical protein